MIVGAGFGGLWAAKALRRAPVDVVVLDRHNYHTFFPLLYQVAAAELDPGDITYPVRTVLRRHPNARFRLTTVQGLDRGRRVLLTDTGEIAYDYLILGVGSTTSFFGVEGAAQHSYRLRTLTEAISLRNHILRRLEAAERSSDDARAAELTFVIVGGGPTGVEFAGALQELLRGPLTKDHPRLDLSQAQIVLVEATGRLLGTYPDRLSSYARRRLVRMGVDVRLRTSVAEIDATGVMLGDGRRVDASTVVWTAGVGGPPELAAWGLETAKASRGMVTESLHIEGDERVWIVGDAAVPGAAFAPMVAQNASQQGTLAARNILRLLDGERPMPYRYKDLGNMAVIGRNAAVVDLFNRFRFTGFVAWAMWLGLHLLKLVGFRNRLAALVSWSGDYLFRDRVSRLIIPGGPLAEPASEPGRGFEMGVDDPRPPEHALEEDESP